VWGELEVLQGRGLLWQCRYGGAKRPPPLLLEHRTTWGYRIMWFLFEEKRKCKG
jgi:hypothetical protein